MIGMNAMAKYIVYTTWYHEKGLRPAEEMQDGMRKNVKPVSYTHLRAHETPEHLVCRLLLEKKK